MDGRPARDATSAEARAAYGVPSGFVSGATAPRRHADTGGTVGGGAATGTPRPFSSSSSSSDAGSSRGKAGEDHGGTAAGDALRGGTGGRTPGPSIVNPLSSSALLASAAAAAADRKALFETLVDRNVSFTVGPDGTFCVGGSQAPSPGTRHPPESAAATASAAAADKDPPVPAIDPWDTLSPLGGIIRNNFEVLQLATPGRPATGVSPSLGIASTYALRGARVVGQPFAGIIPLSAEELSLDTTLDAATPAARHELGFLVPAWAELEVARIRLGAIVAKLNAGEQVEDLVELLQRTKEAVDGVAQLHSVRKTELLWRCATNAEGRPKYDPLFVDQLVPSVYGVTVYDAGPVGQGLLQQFHDATIQGIKAGVKERTKQNAVNGGSFPPSWGGRGRSSNGKGKGRGGWGGNAGGGNNRNSYGGPVAPGSTGQAPYSGQGGSTGGGQWGGGAGDSSSSGGGGGFGGVGGGGQGGRC